MAARKKPTLKAPRGADPPDATSAFPVVGVGAAAGGLEALEALFESLPGRTGAAFVVVAQTPAGGGSPLIELLAEWSALPVVEARDRLPLAPDTVYVSAPGHAPSVQGDRLRVAARADELRRRGPIDAFFESLAAAQGERAIGIVLSGAGGDGSAGLCAIKAQGGMAMVQDPTDAAQPGMPRRAIATGVVDFVTPLARMSDVLLRYLRHPYLRATPAEPDPAESQQLETILETLRVRAGFDFGPYRRGTLLRRVQRRMGLAAITDLARYAERLRRDGEELDRLREDLLIRVTEFFRDPNAFAVLEREVVPALRARPERPVRIWVPGCATGEEAYSIGMLLLEACNPSSPRLDFQIFATDVDESALIAARAGVYAEPAMTNVSSARLERYFALEEGRYRVRRELRDRIVFAVHNIFSDPPLSKLDLISCRNLLIYIEPPVQDAMVSLFHFSLRPGGFLLLGSHEAVRTEPRRFAPLSREWRLYRRLDAGQEELPGASRRGATRDPEALPVSEPEASRSFGELTREALLRLAPAAVLVNRSLEILHAHGPVRRFLDLPEDPPTLALPDLIPIELRARVRAAAQRALASGERVQLDGVRLIRDGSELRVRIRIAPLELPDLLLVGIEEDPPPPSARVLRRREESERDEALRRLEHDLIATREELEQAIRDLEHSNQEIRASHEETVAVNRELQSANEELELSREELQSLNEQLKAMNRELEEKVLELGSTSDDLSNLLTSTNIATLFLDRDLRVKRFTPALSSLVHLRPHDVGRPVSEIASSVSGISLADDARSVLRTLAPLTRQVQRGDAWYVERVLPYRTQDDRVGGVVVTFTDVSDLRRAHDELAEVNRSLEVRIEERTRLYRLVSDVAALANRSDAIAEVVRGALEILCERGGWTLAHVYYHDPSTATLRPSNVWAPESDGFDAFRTATAGSRVRPGEGPVADVFETGRPYQQRDLEGAPDASRRGLGETGLRRALWIPIRASSSSFGVLELFSTDPEPAPEAWVSAMGLVATEIGHAMLRSQTESLAAQMETQEQQRLARDLHDGLGQRVSGIALLAHDLRRSLEARGGDPLRAARELSATVEEAKVELRALVRGLMPVYPGSEGLIDALDRLADETMSAAGIDCSFESQVSDGIEDDFATRHLYFIAQEAVSNAVRHGAPTRVEIRLEEKDGQVDLSVRDDGGGIPAGSPGDGSGLRIMRHRAALLTGRLDVESAPGAGTTVRCRMATGARFQRQTRRADAEDGEAPRR